MKIEINEWLLYLPGYVSFFWIFIYRWRHYSLGKLSKKQKAIVEKEKKKWKFFWDWKDYGLKKEPKHLKLTKTDYVMRGIFFGYLFYFLIFDASFATSVNEKHEINILFKKFSLLVFKYSPDNSDLSEKATACTTKSISPH